MNEDYKNMLDKEGVFIKFSRKVHAMIVFRFGCKALNFDKNEQNQIEIYF